MQFEALKVFCDVARQQSFSRAATANRLSQSAVSQIVNALEQRLGVQLVDRSHRPLILTREGRTYYDGCRRLVEEYLNVEAALRNLSGEIAPTVRGAAIYSVGLQDMGRYVRRFEAGHPAHVELEYLHPDRVYAKVLDGTSDFGLVSFPRKSKQLQSVPWKEEEMVLACPPRHALGGRRSIRLAELQDERYVGFTRELVIRRKVDRFLRNRGVSVDVAPEFDTVENIKRAVEAGEGVALLPRPALDREVQAGTLAAVSLADARLARPLGVIHRRNPKPNSNVRRFIGLLTRREKSRKNGRS